MPEISDPTLLGLTPLDHLPAKLFLPYILYFDTSNSQTALDTLQRGISSLISQLPWLAGEVILHSAPGGPKNRLHIAPSRSPTEVEMLQVKHFKTDEELRTHNIRSYLPLSTFIPASQQRPILRFQANIFPTKIALAMSFWHSVFDGTGAGVILEMLAECCKAETNRPETPLVSTIASTHHNLRRKVSAFPSKCQLRLYHSRALGPPVFDSSISTEQWDAMESAIASAVETKRFIFSPEKVGKMKDICVQILADLVPGAWVSSNDIITAVLAICVDRVLHPERTDKTQSADFLMAVDLRSRVNPPLPRTYLGNAIYPVHDDIYFNDSPVKGEDADLIHLARLAHRVRSNLVSMDENLVYSASAEVAEQDDWTQIDAGPANIIVTSWRNLKVFSLDFGEGLGYIEDFEPGLALVPGGCIFLPERGLLEDRSVAPWEVCVTLTTGVSEMLVRDPLFSRILV